jgi:NADPH:quinone reductase
MRALVCRNYGSPPEVAVEPVKSEAPGPGEVVIRVEAAALSFTDVLMLQGKYQERPALPFVPGLDAAGAVTQIASDVSRFAPGQRVVSSGRVGAFAATLNTDASRLVPIPEGLSSREAVAAINSHMTAFHGLWDRAGLKAGERLLVLGASGAVGRAFIQVGKHLGAEVVAVVRSPAQCEKALQAGADHCIACSPEAFRDELRRLGFGDGVDVVADPIGGDIAEPAVRSLRWRGRYLVVGFAAGAIPRIPLNLLLLKGAAIVGVYFGGLLARERNVFTAQLATLLDLMADGRLARPETLPFPAGEFDAAWRRFHDGSGGRKIVLDLAGLAS